jgi:hypothetical protein
MSERRADEQLDKQHKIVIPSSLTENNNTN